MLRGADGLVFVIQRRLAGDIALQLAGQVDSRLGCKPVERRRLVELIVRMLIQARTDRVEEIVAGMGDAFYDGLIGMQAQAVLVQPAARRVGFIVFVKPAAVADLLRQRKLTVQQTRRCRHHLKNGAGRIAGADGVIDQRVSGIQQDIGRRIAADDKRIGIIGRIARQRQNAAFHVDDDDRALFRQLNRVGFKIARRALKVGLVLIQPGIAVEQSLLLIADVVDVFFQRIFCDALEVRVDGQLDVVAIRRLCRGERPADRAISVNFHHALAYALRCAGGKPILHGLFHTIEADQIRQRVALVLVGRVIRVVVLNLADIADYMAGQRAVRIHALRAHGNADAFHRQRLCLDFDDGLPTDVGGDCDRLRQEGVILHRFPDAEHLNLLFRAQFLGNSILAAQLFKKLLLRVSRGAADVKVAAPHLFARVLLRLRILVVVPREDPKPRHFILHEGERGIQCAAVFLDDIDDVDDRVRINLVLADRLARRLVNVGRRVIGIAVELYVVNLLIIGKRQRVNVHDGAARALTGDGLGLLAFRAGKVVVIAGNLQIKQPRDQNAEEQRHHAGNRPISPQILFIHRTQNLRKCLTIVSHDV